MCSKNQVDSGRTGQLCKAADCLLYIPGSYHHQISKLVHNDHDLRHQHRILSVFCRHGSDLFIIPLHITHMQVRKGLISSGHLGNSPIQGSGRLLWIRYHRNHQMRDPIVDTQFYDLGVDHDQLYLFRRSLIQNTHDQSVDADRFSGTGGTGDQYMRHFGDVCHHNFTADVLSDGKGYLRNTVLKFGRFQQIPEHNRGIFLIGNFYTHGCFSGNRSFNPDIRSCQVQFNVVGQSYDLADFNPHLRLQFIPGHRWTAAYVSHCDMNTEILKCLLQLHRCFPKRRI